MNYIFESKDQINRLIKEADVNGETQKLIDEISDLKNKRKTFYLTIQELEKIFKWKLGNQFGRSREKRENNTSENIKLITQTAFSISHENYEIETKLKLNTLSIIFGVGVPVASAIMTLCYPEKYSVIDFRNWRQLFNTTKNSYSTADYNKYMEKIKILADKFGFTTQQIDLALWQKDIEDYS